MKTSSFKTLKRLFHYEGTQVLQIQILIYIYIYIFLFNIWTYHGNIINWMLKLCLFQIYKTVLIEWQNYIQ